MKRFFLPILIRVLIILGLGWAGIYIATGTYFWLVSIWVFGAMLIAIWELARYLSRSRQEFTEFILAVSQDDFNTRIPEKRRDDLQKAYEILRKRFVQIREDMTANSHFLAALVEHAGVAMIGYEVDTGNITIMNREAKTLLASGEYHQIRALTNIFPVIGSEIEKLKSGEEKLVKVQIDGRIGQLSINAKELVLKDTPYKLVSIKDIQTALENKELESWQKLIRVLTHEIKNSAIPISTLSEVVENIILEDGDLRDLINIDPEEKADLKKGISIIGRRSRSLVEFVNAYGELARLPDPKPTHIPAAEIIETATVLLDDTIKKHSIDMRINCGREMKLFADKTLIEQVVINIIKNAIEAVESSEHGIIEIACNFEEDRPFIDICDNGPGMDTATLDQIFIPFYSTKDQGSGIGLSLSRQIMRAHRGELLAFSVPGQGTRFRLKF